MFGTVCLDLTWAVDRAPEPGGYAEAAGEPTVALGGEAANTAAALVKWGAEPILHGNAVGRGPDAELLRRLLGEFGLAPGAWATDDGPPPVTRIYVAPDGTRTMFGHGFEGFAARVNLDDTPMPAGSWFTSDSNFGATSRDAICRAHAAGCQVLAMDFTRPDDPILPGMLWLCSTDWWGRRGDTEGNRTRLAAYAQDRGCTAILTDGANPPLLAHGGTVVALPTYRVGPIADATGAGDVFRAGLLFGLDQGWPLGRALAFGSAAGGLNCLAMGATTGLPTREQIEGLMAKQPEVTEVLEAA